MSNFDSVSFDYMLEDHNPPQNEPEDDTEQPICNNCLADFCELCGVCHECEEDPFNPSVSR